MWDICAFGILLDIFEELAERLQVCSIDVQFFAQEEEQSFVEACTTTAVGTAMCNKFSSLALPSGV